MKFNVITVELPKQVKLQYVEQGNPQGFPLILLHGFADSWHSFERVLPYLPKSIRVFALTLRGHGDASRPVTGYRPHDFSMDLAAFMDVLELEATVIAGGSSGGIIARCFAIEHPNRTLGLILVSSPLALKDKSDVMALWDSKISKLKDPIDPSFVHEFVKSTLVQQVPQEFFETMIKENLKVPARVWRATLRGLLEDVSSEKLNKVKVPTLIVWGNKDRIIPRSEQETLMKGIAGSRLLVYPGAGHMLYWEEPAHFASDIVAFIENLDTHAHT
jgi:non-heme chloroperoxidase